MANPNFISSLLVDSLKLFDTLISRAELGAYAAEVPTNLWTDELGRLRLWAANIGAHQTGQSSLDYRLRDASHIKGQTIKLLERLRQNLQDLDELLNGVDYGVEDLSLQEDDETEAQQIYTGLVTTVDCLFQISMIIRCPAQHDRLIARRSQVSSGPRIVADRLGAANSRRRAALKYRERHHAKLGKGIDQSDAVSTRLSETIATEFQNTDIDFAETGLNAGLSQTSYAPSLWEGGDRLTVPRPPKESSGGKPFECPYCYYLITVADRRAWIRHVFKDLMPYICAFSDCPTSNRLYDSRREWSQHLQTRFLSGFAPGDNIDCLLRCGARLPVMSLERHLGKHLEELALFALRGFEEDEEQDEEEYTKQSHSSIADATSEDRVGNNSCEDERESEAKFTGLARELELYLLQLGELNEKRWKSASRNIE
ncbi:hypothetical protein A1O1_02992 [Capronia coronata CBS 617.96]|uniref:Oxidoreductase acuF-like C2H2 type zinc-finger domain-containing protein n=1 Tax=Capronia coronata CBS 617.96 TaxID=1182541 RepID=W9YZ76_9EURO|nr:uncharacterized protein A1O1_02992 [Capronia coronata CBS 617.96]EXJ94596.1 hypothetical protein A1O1_02992 [Capronia coronata CBS 617.96]